MMNVVIAKPAHSKELRPKIVKDLIAAPQDSMVTAVNYLFFLVKKIEEHE